MEKEELRFCFPEFDPYEGSCKFQGCIQMCIRDSYLDMNLPMAKYAARKYLDEVLYDITEDRLNYPD